MSCNGCGSTVYFLTFSDSTKEELSVDLQVFKKYCNKKILFIFIPQEFALHYQQHHEPLPDPTHALC